MFGVHGREMSEKKMNIWRGETLSEHSSSQLKLRVEQIATHEEEMSRNMEKCMEQQQQLAQLVEGLGKQLSSIADQSCPKCSLKRLSNPWRKSDPGNVTNTKSSVQDTDLDLGKFSGSDLVPMNELTFEQWLSDIRAYQ